jgi:hypothetical protein
MTITDGLAGVLLSATGTWIKVVPLDDQYGQYGQIATGKRF